jgi:hypothetical protein
LAEFCASATSGTANNASAAERNPPWAEENAAELVAQGYTKVMPAVPYKPTRAFGDKREREAVMAKQTTIIVTVEAP